MKNLRVHRARLIILLWPLRFRKCPACITAWTVNKVWNYVSNASGATTEAMLIIRRETNARLLMFLLAILAENPRADVKLLEVVCHGNILPSQTIKEHLAGEIKRLAKWFGMEPDMVECAILIARIKSRAMRRTMSQSGGPGPAPSYSQEKPYSEQ